MNTKQKAIEIANQIYKSPQEGPYGKLFRKIKTAKDGFWTKRKKLKFLNYLSNEIDEKYDNHVKNECKKPNNCSHKELYQNLYNNIQQFIDDTEKITPWYKQTWLIITGLIALFGTVIIATNNFLSVLDRYENRNELREQLWENVKYIHDYELLPKVERLKDIEIERQQILKDTILSKNVIKSQIKELDSLDNVTIEEYDSGFQKVINKSSELENDFLNEIVISQKNHISNKNRNQIILENTKLNELIKNKN